MHLCTVHHLLVTAMLPGFETSLLVYGMSEYMTDFTFLKFNSFFFFSTLMINGVKKSYFHISTAEYFCVHLLYK